jgi:hypothetical protein
MGIDISETNGMNMMTPLQSLPGAATNAMPPVSFSIGRRNLGASSAPFEVMQSSVGVTQGGQLAQNQGLSTALVINGNGANIKLNGVTQLDGEYVVLVATAPGGGEMSLAKKGAKVTTSGAGGIARGIGLIVVWANLLTVLILL